MLEELRNLEYSPTKEGLDFFLSKIMGEGTLDKRDIDVLCSHAPGSYRLSANHLLQYCRVFNWVMTDECGYSLRNEIASITHDESILNKRITEDIINCMFDEDVIQSDMFVYEADKDRIRFRDECLPLDYSSIRNTLVNLEFFEIDRLPQRTLFYLSDDYMGFVGKRVKKQKKKYSLEQLKKQLEKNEEAGRLAEEFVLQYERKRLPNRLKDRIRIISDIDVSAGYDIVSFESAASASIDRYIEVKAVDSEIGFYWSENEYEVAKLKGSSYYLYLVYLSSISNSDYEPIIICNPADFIMKSEKWLVETQSYHVRKISE